MSRFENALGVAVEVPDDMVQAVEVAAVIKGLDTAGKLSYWTVSSPGLMTIEIMGMMEWGKNVALTAGDDEPATD